MEENKQADVNPTSNKKAVTPANVITEMSEDDLEQVSGGSKNNVLQGMTQNKHKTADKISKQWSDFIKS